MFTATPSRATFFPTGSPGRDRVHAVLEIEAELSGPGNGWTDLTPDVMIRPAVKIGYGIAGGGPLDLVASTGHLSFTLDNSEFNSAETLGYYSFHHPHRRPGFEKGIRVRCLMDGDVKFIGRLKAASPVSGKHRERKTFCTAADFMDEFANVKVTLPTQIDQRVDEIVDAILAEMERQPEGTDFQEGDSVFPFALDNSRDDSTGLTLLQQLAQSEFSRVYPRGNGTLVVEKRSARLTPMPVASFHGTMHGLAAPSDTSKTKNLAAVTAHPRDVGDTDEAVLFSKPNQNNPPINPGQTVKLTGRYADPANRASGVGGTDMQAPVATTDYLFNAAANGGGADLTADLDVVAVYGGNQVDYELTNTGGGVGYLTKLQARGRALLDYTPITSEERNQDSIDDIGESPVTLDMPFQSDAGISQAVAEFIAATWSLPGDSEPTLEFVPRTQAEMDVARGLEPGDPIAVSEEVTGLNGVFYVQHVEIVVHDFDNMNTEFAWKLQRANVADFGTLDDEELGVLDVSAVLAPL